MKSNLVKIFTLLTLTFSNAQVKNKGTVEITPKIGYSSYAEVSKVNNGSVSSTVTSDYKSSFAFGATLDYYFSKGWSIRSGFSYDKMGGEQNFNGKKYDDNFSYLSVPVNANWHFGSTKKWNLNFGLSPSFLTKTEFLVDNQKATTTILNPIKSFQLGLSLGIGYKIEINQKFGILLEYQGFSGLTNISNVQGIKTQNAGGNLNVGAVIEL